MPTPNEAHLSEEQRDSLHLLLKDFTSLNRAEELQTVLERSVEIVQHVMNTEGSLLMLLDKKTVELLVKIPTGLVHKEIRREDIAEETGIGEWIVEHKDPFCSNNVENSEVFTSDLSEDFTARNIISVPLVNKNGRVIGALEAINRLIEQPFEDADIPIFKTLADYIGIAIERTWEKEQIQKELREKELKFTEVHHRIKNSLATLTSLIEIELAEVEDEMAGQLLRKTCSRIESMTSVHDLLHNSGLEKQVDLGAYLKRLTQKVSSLAANPAQNITVDIEVDSVLLDTERIMSCGLLVNELLVNSYKHAFNDDAQSGTINVRLAAQSDGIISLCVSDNGKGLDEQFSFENAESIGSWLIQLLSRKLNASIDINNKDGTEFIIQFEK